MFFLTIGALIAAVAAITAVVVLIIKYRKVQEQLRQLKIKQAQERVVALIHDGDYDVISGVWDNTTGTLEQGSVLRGSQIDDETREYLPENDIVMGF